MSAPIPQSLFSSRGLTFEDAKRKGSKLMQRIQSRGNKESRWTDYTSLATDSWEISNYEKQRLYLVGLKGPSDEYGWSTEYVEWYGLHEGSGEDEYWTVAAYDFKFNVKDGVLVTTFAVSGRGHKDKVSRLSDVGWLAWKHNCAKSSISPGTALNHYIHAVVTNEDTKAIANTALKAMNRTLTDWPGHTFCMNSDEGLALLGTRNGKGLTWMIIDHQAEFGKRTIVSVTIWCDTTKGMYLMFNLGESGKKKALASKTISIAEPSRVRRSRWA